ncbi:MAG: neutral/alkaline non-lysosomal ceramidase N-terminal domain-containing protein, partial [Armatimonadetes bacterium]|nr:neutral/alkaline non-lysosomal ceramidase N-terminal domain-containing protein [Armatimonadota bacterium]
MSEVDITPPVGTSLVGYFDDRKSTGIHDPLYAQTILLESGDTRVAMMTTDLIALLPETVEKAKALAARDVPVPPENIFIHTTHTHTGPATVSAFGVDKDDAYLSYLPKLLAGSILEAYHRLEPANLGFGRGSEGDISFNRRYLMKDGTVRTNPGVGDKWDEAQGKGNPDIVQPTGPIDPEVTVMRVESEIGDARCLVVNYACHDDTVGGTLMSADYPGVVRKVLRRVFGAGVMPAFFNGACGNLNHVNFQALNL